MLVLPNMAPPNQPSSASLWRRLLRLTTRTISHLGYFILKSILVAWILLFLPNLIHIIVRSLDDMHEDLGRRARSPFKTRTRLTDAAGLGLLAWGMWLLLVGGLVYKVVVDEVGHRDSRKLRTEGEEEKRSTERRAVGWGMVLGRVSIVSVMILMVSRLLWELKVGRPLITANTVDLEDDARAGLVWRDQ